MVATGCFMIIPEPPPEKMTCGEALDLMPSYRAGKIPFASQRKQIEAHLAHCPRCRIAYERTA